MNNISASNNLISHLSEKANKIAEQKKKQYVFRVKKSLDKNTLKLLISSQYNVDIESINLCNCIGKKKLFRQKIGRRNDYKKAYVTLKDGYAIKVSEEG